MRSSGSSTELRRVDFATWTRGLYGPTSRVLVPPSSIHRGPYFPAFPNVSGGSTWPCMSMRIIPSVSLGGRTQHSRGGDAVRSSKFIGHHETCLDDKIYQ